jgi:hypothetical protein
MIGLDGHAQRSRFSQQLLWVAPTVCCLLGTHTLSAGDGPDGIVSTLGSSVASYGHEDPSGTGDFISAFAVGLTWCNVGTEPLDALDSSNQQGAFHQSLYRLDADRLEQVGLSWVWYSFYVLNRTGCGLTCENVNGPGNQLFPGCADPEPHVILGTRAYLGPTSDVDAFTGFFPASPTLPTGSGAIANRLQVHDTDLDPALNEGALYFIQMQHVHPGDAAAGNGANNASYQRVSVSYMRPPIDRYNVSLQGTTQAEKSVIRAWRDHDPAVVETEVAVPEEGVFIVAGKATEIGDGYWHYEYAVQNLNSDRSGGSFSVPLPIGAVVENAGFHDVDYHSGEPWDGTDWIAAFDGDSIRWSTTPYDENPSANALRWSTLYNFRFDANVPPEATSVTLGLFKPGTPTEVLIATRGPSLAPIDCNRNGVADLCDVNCAGLGCRPPCEVSEDCDENRVPDECETDCNANSVPDVCDIAEGLSDDCDESRVPDECEPDCDDDGTIDACELVLDTDADGVEDCEDLCPETTRTGRCLPPLDQMVNCCFSNHLMYDWWTWRECESFCVLDPDPENCGPVCGNPPTCPGRPCLESRCRSGCLFGDADRDGDLDLRDVGAFMNCFTGPLGAAGSDCRFPFDVDDDSYVDLGDFARFFGSSTGP